MTMRQVSGLLKVINKSELTDFYNSLLSYGTIHGAKLPSLNDFLDTSLGKTENIPQFDDKTEKALEEHALKVLNERRKLG